MYNSNDFWSICFNSIIKISISSSVRDGVLIIVVLGIVARICGISIFSIIKILKDELLLAFSTSSSEAVLPVMMKKMEKFGAPRDVTSFVIPIGYSFNLDGSALYQSIAALFVAQMYGIHLSISEQIIFNGNINGCL